MRGEPRRTTRPGRVARFGALPLLCLLSAGCAAPGTVDLTAEVVQYRRDAQRDVIQVKVTNGGGRAVQVGRVEVRSPTFAAPASADKDSTIGAGRSVDLSLPLAEPSCAEAGDGAGEHVAVLVVDGTTVRLPVDDAVLQRVRSQRCAEAAVGDLVATTWQPGWEDAGVVDGEPALRGRLVLTPTSSSPVTVAVAGATTLFTVDQRVEVTLRGGPAVLDVVVTVTRCDPHAVAEDKKGYLFPVRVTPDGGEEVHVEVAVPVPERAALQGLIDRTCS
ncbi:hypothetical protein [Aquipuribacter sp. MA13-6]|uniref:hypothetical protein n=1 Tax=unclassified Aquipuribacter TaxID=2635084 RepID=UPI003EE96439